LFDSLLKSTCNSLFAFNTLSVSYLCREIHKRRV
jgi:hypothetical protein